MGVKLVEAIRKGGWVGSDVHLSFEGLNDVQINKILRK